MTFSFLFPIVILLLSLNLVIFDTDFYKKELPTYEENKNVITNLLTYFYGGKLNTQHYTEQELSHLKDVRIRIWLSLLLLTITIIILFTYLIKKTPMQIKKELIYGGTYTLFALLLLSIILTNFSSSFTLFHKLLFTNDYWLLPQTALLIQIFPERFFLESTKQIILYSFIFSLLCISLGRKIPLKHNET